MFVVHKKLIFAKSHPEDWTEWISVDGGNELYSTSSDPDDFSKLVEWLYKGNISNLFKSMEHLSENNYRAAVQAALRLHGHASICGVTELMDYIVDGLRRLYDPCLFYPNC